jgi:hypothetical protein
MRLDMLPSDLSFDFQSGPTTHNLEHLPDFFTFAGPENEMSTEVEILEELDCIFHRTGGHSDNFQVDMFPLAIAFSHEVEGKRNMFDKATEFSFHANVKHETNKSPFPESPHPWSVQAFGTCDLRP